MNSRRLFLTLAASTLCLSVSPFAFAATAEAFVKAKQEELTALIKGGAPDAKVDKVFDQVLDYPALAKSALRDHWDARTEAERKEFTDLLARLVRNSYRKNLKKTLGYSVEYMGASKADAGEVVRTVAKSKTNAREEPFSIDYIVRTGDGGPRIVDIVTEGSSMVGNYRTSFNKVIKKSGFPEVLVKMRKKIDGAGDGAD